MQGIKISHTFITKNSWHSNKWHKVLSDKKYSLLIQSVPATFSQDSLALWALEEPVAWSSATWRLVAYRTLYIRYMSHAVYIIYTLYVACHFLLPCDSGS